MLGGKGRGACKRKLSYRGLQRDPGGDEAGRLTFEFLFSFGLVLVSKETGKEL